MVAVLGVKDGPYHAFRDRAHEIPRVSHSDTLLSDCRSTTSRGSPFSFAVAISLLHHGVGVLDDTGLMKPMRQFLSISALTFRFQL